MMKVEDMSRDDYEIRCKELELEALKLKRQVEKTGERLHEALGKAIMSNDDHDDFNGFIKLIKDHHAVRKLFISSICEQQMLKNDFDMHDKIKLIQLMDELKNAPDREKREQIFSEITDRLEAALRSNNEHI